MPELRDVSLTACRARIYHAFVSVCGKDRYNGVRDKVCNWDSCENGSI